MLEKLEQYLARICSVKDTKYYFFLLFSDCGLPPDVVNGTFILSEIPDGYQAHYECDNGYGIKHGSPDLTCSFGIWCPDKQPNCTCKFNAI